MRGLHQDTWQALDKQAGMTHGRTKHFGIEKRHPGAKKISPLTFNELLARFVAGFGGGVDAIRLFPPPQRAEDDMYLIYGIGVGEWKGEDEKVATWFRGNWIFTPLVPGAFVHDWSTGIMHRYVGYGSGFVETSAVWSTKSYGFTTQGVGVGSFYPDGWYDAASTAAALTQAGASQAFGSTNVGYGGHAFVVCGGAGSVDTGVVGLQANGEAVTDEGAAGSTTELIIPDITATSVNQYFESSKKWIGQVTFSLVVVSGSPTAYSLSVNYGLGKYENFDNREFTVLSFEATAFAGNNDSNFNVELLHHSPADWTYAASGFVPGGTVLSSLIDTYGSKNALSTGEYTAFKRTKIDTLIAGNASEGVVVRITTSQPNAIEQLNAHVKGRLH